MIINWNAPPQIFEIAHPSLFEDFKRDTARCNSFTGFAYDELHLICKLMMTNTTSIKYDKTSKTWDYNREIRVHLAMKMHPMEMAVVAVAKLKLN